MRELVKDLSWRTKPSLFARRCSLLGYNPDPKQCELLDCYQDALLLCTRQWGKSTTTAVKAAHHGATTPEGLVLIVAPSERQSMELLRKVKQTIRQTQVARIIAESKTALELDNGCRFFALPGHEETIRGFSAVTLLIGDEAARISPAVFEAVSPMLGVSHGQTIYLTSAWYKIGSFYEEWQLADPRWRRITVTADECPRLTPEFLERERRTTYRGKPAEFLREYWCQFQDLEGVALALEWFDKAVGKASLPKLGELREQPPDPNFKAWFGGAAS